MSSKSDASSRCAAANVDGESGGGVLGASSKLGSWIGGGVVGGLVEGGLLSVVVVGAGGGLEEARAGAGAGGGGGLAWWEVK